MASVRIRKKPKSFKRLKAIAWSLFSEYIRRRDADQGGTVNCYTCGVLLHWKYGAQAGHAIGGRHNAVLLDESICRPQCYRCNCALGGNYPIFAAKLIRENGLEWFESKLHRARQVVKYSRGDIESLINDLKDKLERLEAASC